MWNTHRAEAQEEIIIVNVIIQRTKNESNGILWENQENISSAQSFVLKFQERWHCPRGPVGDVNLYTVGHFYYLSWKCFYADQLWLREELLVANFQGKVAFPKEVPKEEVREHDYSISF